MKELFNQLVVKLNNLGEIQYKTIFIDGTKIEAYANKYIFVWKKTTAKNELKLQEKTKGLRKPVIYNPSKERDYK